MREQLRMAVWGMAIVLLGCGGDGGSSAAALCVKANQLCGEMAGSNFDMAKCQEGMADAPQEAADCINEASTCNAAIGCSLLVAMSQMGSESMSSSSGSGSGSDMFECADGSGSFPMSWVCDGGPDCADESDEANCDTDTGSETEEEGDASTGD